MDSYNWYLQLKKPAWAPPGSLFGPVWSVLYILIFLSFGAVIYQAVTSLLPWVITIPFILNLVFNFSFTYFQFGLRNNLLASADIVLVAVTLVWAMVIIWPYLNWVTLINIPYLLWVLFATALQLTITSLNRQIS
jgi:tryptophan-rich sensory protein